MQFWVQNVATAAPHFSVQSVRVLSAAYVVYGLVMAIFLTWYIPSFRNPDEPNHFLKADQISRGQLVSDRGGGLASTAISTATRGSDVGWDAQVSPTYFASSAIYPPALYLPTAAAILAGKAMSLSVIETLRLARLTNAVVSLAVIAIAILIAGSASIWIFMLCSLPMSVSLLTSVSQDGLIIAFTSLACALLLRRSGLTLPTVLLTLVAMAKPPYVVLALALIATANAPRSTRAICMTALFACVAAWTLIANAYSVTRIRTDIHAIPAEQVRYILTAPLEFVKVMIRSLYAYKYIYAESFVGTLGLMELYLSKYYYVFAGATLIACAACLRPKADRKTVALAAAALATTIGIFLSLYLVWNEVGAPLIDGVQGRYFIPIAIALITAIPMTVSHWQTFACLLFLLVTAVETMRAVTLFF